MDVFESWFRTATYATDRYHSWRMTPWWTAKSRGCRQRSLLQVLAISHDQRLDPAPLLNNHADEQVGPYRARVRRFARRVAAGTSIVEAAEQTPEVLGDEAVLAIRFGAQTGTLSQTYRDLISTRDIANDQPQLKLQHTFIYTVMSLVAIAIATLFLARFIFPNLTYIFEQFDREELDTAPVAFKLLTSILKHLSEHTPLYVLLVITVAALYWSTPTRRMFKRYLIPRWMNNHAQARISQILRLIAIALEAGRPVSSALSTLAHYHYDDQVRQKLLLARNQIEQGTAEWQSLANVRLLNAIESQALEDSSTKLSKIWTIRQLAERKRTNALNHANRAASFALPTITFLMAAIVLLFCSALFGFLSHAILLLN